VPAGKVENGMISGLDWFPTLLAAAGNPNIGEELKKGKHHHGAAIRKPPQCATSLVRPLRRLTVVAL
jgi:arylsulfatase A-like enzyme